MLFLCSVSLLVKVIRLERHAGGLKVFYIVTKTSVMSIEDVLLSIQLKMLMSIMG